jgi:short-subunit dehydrogenase
VKTCILASRNPEEASKAIAQIRAETGLDNIHCMKLDLGEAASIEEFSSRWKAHGLPLHILVNNAGALSIFWRGKLIAPTHSEKNSSITRYFETANVLLQEVTRRID